MRLLVGCVFALAAFPAVSQVVPGAKSVNALRFETLYDFNGARGSAYPAGGVILDAQENLYGTTEGGPTDYGSVFEVSPSSGSGWRTATLYTFQSSSGGSGPVSNLVFDANGNLYGVTAYGGVSCTFGTCGTVFELSPSGGGWQETTIYEFQGGDDGSHPFGSLILDALGNLYGTTSDGGGTCGTSISGCGTVFELSPVNGAWTETVLHHFTGGHDGATPAGLVFDSQGNLYGNASRGGNSKCSCGTVFELSPNLAGGWTGKTLHEFTGANDGLYPGSTLVFDKAGNLYGNTGGGGRDNDGVVFRLVPSAGGWTEQLLHTFHGLDGRVVYVGVVLDGSGNVYGTTQYGGDTGDGVVYELTPTTVGEWNYSRLHSFQGSDGVYPNQLVLDSHGHFFGTTNSGGTNTFGTVFTLTP